MPVPQQKGLVLVAHSQDGFGYLLNVGAGFLIYCVIERRQWMMVN